MSFLNNQLIEKYIYDSNHLDTVNLRVRATDVYVDSVKALDLDGAIASIKKFYDYVENDHELYNKPDDLLKAAVRRCHFFIGVTYASSIHIDVPMYKYSLLIDLSNAADDLKNEHYALEFTYGVAQAFIESGKALKVEYSGYYSKKAQTYVQFNIDKSLTALDIAKELHVNPDYLNRKVKKEIGITITDLIRDEKIKSSKLYLMYTDYKINEISSLLGYSSPSYFSKVFREYEGLSPSSFREQNK